LSLQAGALVGKICFEVGDEKFSNFNRHFHAEKEQIPSEYRRETAMTLLNRIGTHRFLPFTKVH